MFKCRFVLLPIVFVSFCFLSKLFSEEMDLKIKYPKCPDIATAFEAVSVHEYSKITIILSDGSQWVIRNSSSESVFDHISTHWCEGDEIRVRSREPDKYHGRFLLKNVRNNEVYLVDLDSICTDQSKAFYIENIDENGYAILTQNELLWSFGWWGSMTTRNWRIGDRIIINKSDYDNRNDYVLINADKGSNAWGSLISWRSDELIIQNF